MSTVKRSHPECRISFTSLRVLHCTIWIVFGLLEASAFGGPHMGIGLASFSIIIVIVFVLFAVRGARSAVIVSHDSILIRGQFRSHRFAVREVDRFEACIGPVGLYKRCYIVVHTHSKTYHLTEFNGPLKGKRVDVIPDAVSRLNSMLGKAG